MNEKIVYRSESKNPYFNIAFEHWLFNRYQEDADILYLWCNAPSVIIGRFQNPWRECKLSLMQEKGINLVRRESGGGAVFHDLGNAIFSFFSPFSDESSEHRNYDRLIKTLRHLGLESEQSSRNDLIIRVGEEVRKVSGNAFKKKGRVSLHHGTMLINTDLSELSHYLTPNPKKLSGRGITSVRSRVINLGELNSTITVNSFEDTLERVFWEEDPTVTHQTIWVDETLLLSEPALKSEFDRLQSRDWVLGKTPQFNHTLEETFDFGSWTIHMEVEDLIIKQVEIFTDCLSVPFVESLSESLQGTEYSARGVNETFSRLAQEGDVLTSPWIMTLHEWIRNTIS